MSYFGLNPVNQNQQLDEAASNPAGFNSDVGFFDNAVGAALSGLYSGLVAKPDQLLWAGMDKIVSPIAQFVNENTSLNDTSVSYIAEQRKLAEQQVKRLTPDAATTGTAGQVLYGLFDMGGQAVIGTTLGGPVGGAAAVTSLQGFSEFERLTAQGVDFRTAQEAGLVQGITAGAGTLIPMSLGLRAGGALAEGVAAQLARTGESSVRRAAATAVRATPDIAYAAGTNIAFGMAQRGLTAKTLRDGGYSEMANQYDVLDRQAIAIDAVLGVAFGGVGRFINSHGEATSTPNFSPVDVDAALAANAAHHAEIDISPGVPINVLSRNSHIQALRKAMSDVSQGRPVDVASIVESASFSEIPGRKNLLSQAVNEALSSVDDGATARAIENRLLEERAAQLLPRGDRQVYQSEIANSQRIIENLTEQRAQILAEEPTGSGKALSRARSDKQARLRDIDQRIRQAQERLEFSRNALAPHEPGGQFFEARAELARRQQAESELNAQAVSFYKTAEVRTPDEVAPFEPGKILQQAEQKMMADPAGDIDLRIAEDSLLESPDMIITVLDDDGNPQSRRAREVLDEANRESEQAIQDSSLFDVAVACFLRG
ncbi:TPA: M3 family metallopeptidase [Escherichia coli]|nr:M3 family metallopeptidase [Escherichia coli]HBA6422623.1 M3 family metallopeptidase [Escherichia coli]HBA6437359.1 M3 family metallopeptidase [Escherichia coli]HBA6649690.1 M3 family metallopeptidase [Escherichia coli]HBA6748068.1 M3 family metallopeptidase [Escherichia coli]